MFKHPLLYVWIVLVASLAGVGWFRPTTERGQMKIGSQREQASAGTQKEQPKSAAPAPTIGQGQDKQNAARNDQKATQPEQSKDSDAPKWTDVWIAQLTVVLAAVAAAQLIAAILQAIWTGKAVRVAKESADAATASASMAKRTVEVMEGTAEKQLRAYVFITPTGHQLKATKQRRFVFELRNRGNTPAYGVTCDTWLSLQLYPLPKGTKFVAPDPGATSMVLGPQSPIHHDHEIRLQFHAQARARLAAGTHRYYAVVVVTYRDMFSPEKARTTRFCASVPGDQFLAALDAPIGHNPDIQWKEFPPEHNGAD